MSFTSAQEAALLRTLRDIADGHLTVWVDRTQYDPMRGQLVPHGDLNCRADREPAAGIPNRGGAWWAPMLQRGWLAVHMTGGRPYLRCESPGLQTLRDAEADAMWSHTSGANP